MMRTCKAEDCGRRHIARGHCRSHYDRDRRVRMKTAFARELERCRALFRNVGGDSRPTLKAVA